MQNIHSTCIKLPNDFKPFVLSILSGPLTQVLLYQDFDHETSGFWKFCTFTHVNEFLILQVNGNTLRITQATMGDRGIYVCRVENAAGSDQDWAVVEVERKTYSINYVSPLEGSGNILFFSLHLSVHHKIMSTL